MMDIVADFAILQRNLSDAKVLALQLVVWMIDHCAMNMQNACQTNMVIMFATATMDITEMAELAHVCNVQ